MDMASVENDPFLLKTGAVILKGHTSQLRLSLSGPVIRQETFFQSLSAGRTRCIQIRTTTRRKGRGGTLSHYLPNECSPPHSSWLNAGGLSLWVSWAFIPPRDLKRRQSIPITIKCKHFTFPKTNKDLDKWETEAPLWKHEKGIQQPRLPLKESTGKDVLAAATQSVAWAHHART